jgi:carboxyl-terminal processing protease
MRKDLSRMYKTLIICFLVVFAGTSLGAYAASNETYIITAEDYKLLQEYKHMNDIREIIEGVYYKDVDEQALVDGATQGMFTSLGDPYSFYYTKEAMDKMREEMTGEYKGIGVQILAHPENLTVNVVRVFKESPAEAAGIRAGDIIIQVDDLAVTAYEMNDAVSIMRGGPAGTTVDVTVRRGDEEIKYTVTRGDIHMNTVDSEMLENGIGYIRLYSFEGTMNTEYTAALAKLREQGMTALIIDLRDNPGGLTTYAEAVADTILTKELIYSTQDKYGLSVDRYASGKELGVPLVVLCNGNSASSSEILIGAVKDNGKATIIGEQTFGKGIIQSVYEFPEGDGMQVTSQQYLTPNGSAIHGVGITPDVVVELAEDAYDAQGNIIREKDNQLAAAIEQIQGAAQ